MSTLCLCGCKKPAHPGTQYYGTTEEERNRHRSKRLDKRRAEERKQVRNQAAGEQLVRASPYAHMSVTEMAASLEETLRLVGAVVGHLAQRMSQTDEASVADRIEAAQSLLLDSSRQLEQDNARLRCERDDLSQRLAREQNRAEQADADSVAAQKSIQRLEVLISTEVKEAQVS